MSARPRRSRSPDSRPPVTCKNPPTPDFPFTSLAANLANHLDYLVDYGKNWPPEEVAIWAEVHRRVIEGHGTRWRYQMNDGCRCDWCQEAQNAHNRGRGEYMRQWRQRRKKNQDYNLEEDEEL